MRVGKHKIDLLFFTSFLSLLFLVFLLGIAFGGLKIYPYPLLRDAGKALVALRVHIKNKGKTKFESNLWHPVRKEYLGAKGVTIHKSGLAYNGYTLYTSGHDQKAFLINMDGRVVHEWHLPLSGIWEPSWNHNRPPKEDRIYFRDAYLYPNGDILLLYIAFGPSPWGLTLVKADKNSQPIWKYPKKMHHDIEVGPDGKIYALSHKILKNVPQNMAFLPTPIFEDDIVILDPDGQEIKEISIVESFANSEYREMLKIFSIPRNGDIFHTNSIVLVTSEISRKFPFTRTGQLLVCLRNLNTLALIDPQLEKVVWIMTGPWKWPHDPDFLNNGNMMIFDNLWKNPVRSRVVEFDPLTRKIVWQYQGDDDKPLYSFIRSRQQVLPNGNILICESDGGRLVEVNRKGEIAWEFVNPVLESYKGQTYIPVISTGRRYSANELPFLSE